MTVPSISQQILDHQGQREKLAAFFRRNPFTIYSQETLAEACGCAIGTVRSRVSECKTKLKMAIRVHPVYCVGDDGRRHRDLNMYELVERPAEPLGRDAADQIPSGLLAGVEWAQR